MCFSESIEPPKNQPSQKSYKDFNTSWPLNSWSVTENSCGYQVNYIRLLSKFVDPTYDCNGDKNGSAAYDACGVCAGGNTGRTPTTDPSKCITNIRQQLSFEDILGVEVYPNPARNSISISAPSNLKYSVKIISSNGHLITDRKASGRETIDISGYPGGLYLVLIEADGQAVSRKIVKL